MEDPLVRYYREHDDFLRYTVRDRERKRALSKLCAENKGFFGKRVLDVACGGGVLAQVLKEDCEYVGIDKNPDMINAARARFGTGNPRHVFILGDATSVGFDGVFDTVTLLGNAVIHFNPSEVSRILRRLRRHTKAGSHFMVEYRDVVSMLFDGKWSRRYADKLGRRVTTSLTRGIDAERGEIAIDSFTRGYKKLRFTHAIWSPFILEAVMSGSSWSLVKRERTKNAYVWLDIYRRV